MTAPRRRIRALVSGRVQGVGFRWFVVEAGRGLGLGGWVRNLPGGDVECEAEGAPADVEAFLGALRRGPPLARVAEVRAVEVPPREEFDFEARFG